MTTSGAFTRRYVPQPGHHDYTIDRLMRRLRQNPYDTTTEEVLAMSPTERAEHDQARLRRLAEGVIVNNRNVQSFTEQLHGIREENRGRGPDGYGLRLEAMSGSGKTTAIECALADVLLEHLDDNLEPHDPNRIPVAHLQVFPGNQSSPLRAVADYVGSPYKLRRGGLTPEQAVEWMQDVGMDVVVFDEMQNLRAKSDDETVADTIRAMALRLEDVTVVMAGYRDGGLGLTDGKHGAQVAGRFDEVEWYDFTDDTQEDFDVVWRTHLMGMLAALPLHGMDPADESKLWKPLYDKTAGSMLHSTRLLTRISRLKIQQGDLRRETVTVADIRNASVILPAQVTRHRDAKRVAAQSRRR